MHSIAASARVAVASLLSLLLASPAMSDDRRLEAASIAANLSRIRIHNFGRVNDGYYRGAEPVSRDYADLAGIGVRTLVDLRGKDVDPAEKLEATRAGLAYVQIPMTTHEVPTQAKLDQFLQIVTDPERLPVFVHCVGGRHRTGVMTAVYRMARDGWSAEQAFQEMKAYKFGPDYLHPEFKAFVYRYTPAPLDSLATPAVQAVAR